MEKVLEQYKALQPISDFFPIKMKDGGILETLTAKCPDCKEASQDNLFRGTVVQAFDAVIIDAYGYCKGCNHIYPVLIRYRVIDGKLDASYMTESNTWARGLVKSGESILDKLDRLFKKTK